MTYYATTGKFKTTIKDVTTGVSFAKTSALARATRSSAECIAKAPSGDPSAASCLYPRANFGTVIFGQGNTQITGNCEATVNGSSKGLRSFGIKTDQLFKLVYPVPPAIYMASPYSATSSGTSSIVTW